MRLKFGAAENKSAGDTRAFASAFYQSWFRIRRVQQRFFLHGHHETGVLGTFHFLNALQEALLDI